MPPLRRLTTALALAAAVAVLAVPATGRDGLVAKSGLHRVPGSDSFGVSGGVKAWLLVRGDGSVQQQFSVWAQGLFGEDFVTLWMAAPGDLELEQVAEMAVYGDAARFQVGRDSNREANPDLPLGVERVLELLRAPVEVRIPDVDDDIRVLEGEVGVFRLRSISTGGGRKGVASRSSRLKRPRRPLEPVDEEARGYIRLWRERGDRSGQGITVFAQGLAPETDYEVHIEGPDGELVPVADDVVSTAEGQALFVVNTRDGPDETLPEDLEVDSVSELAGRRIEVRQAGSDEYSLVGILPRVGSPR